ncbi:MAG: HEAT repeat domain-containing protein, partial [Planctomycetes bacterium]|nr:HEAT repeat domain-containing protein [Planctomycetota bacterium]
MRNSIPILLLIVSFVIFGLSAAFGQDKESKPQKTKETDVQTLIEQLGAQDYNEREEAFNALKALGDQARDALKNALDHEDPEIRWRASRLLTAMEGKKLLHLGEADGEGNFSKLQDQLNRFKQLPGIQMDPLTDEFFELHRDLFQGRFGDFFREFLEGVSPKDRLGNNPSLPPRIFDGLPLFGFEGLIDALKDDDRGLSLEIDGQHAKCRMSVKTQTEDGEEAYTLEIA